MKRPLVSVVDDDESIRESLPDLLSQFGFAVAAFSSAKDFLASDLARQSNCLILDIAMPEMSGPELQQELRHREQVVPIIFITARRDEEVRAHLMRLGAIECLFKPFTEDSLLKALGAVFERT